MGTWTKTRLDKYIVEKGLAETRSRGRDMILRREVSVNGKVEIRPGRLVSIMDEVTHDCAIPPFAGRGGLKLNAALDQFCLKVEGFICLDVGASTGGFTDCLLEHGAAKVYAVDAGREQLIERLRKDPRVLVMEGTNIRHVSQKEIPELVDLVVIDVSFISLRIVVPEIIRFLKPEGRIIALIKPQFECGKKHIGKKGVIRDNGQRQSIVDSLMLFFKSIRLRCIDVMTSPITGKKGNQEYFIYLTKTG